MTISKNPENIKAMFNHIAKQYDFNNFVISLGLHGLVKLLSIKKLRIYPHSTTLDECCGTGDLAGFIKKLHPNANVSGIDFSENMLALAKKKFPNVNFIQGDCTKLPFDKETFDVITMGFGLRNIQNYQLAISETYRVLKYGGQFMHLDFGQKNVFSKIFDFIVPPLVKIFYGNNLPYSYLIKSKQEFPPPLKLIKLFEQYGFRLKIRKDFLFGIISMQILEK